MNVERASATALRRLPPVRDLLRDRQLRERLRRAMNIGTGAISIPGQSGMESTGFNGNFANIFPGALQSVQTDLGLTYGGTMLNGGGATDTVSLTGSGGIVKPILAKGTGTGVVSLYTDGGTTPVATGITPSAGIPVAVPGTSMSLTWTAATIASGHTWTATCSALADQSGNGQNYAQATLAQQFIVTPGVNGIAGIATYTPTAGAGQNMAATGLTLANSGSFLWSIFRLIGTTTALGLIFCDGNGVSTGGSGSVLDTPTSSSTNTQMFNTTGVNTNTASTLNAWGRAEVSFTNSTSDYYKFGSTNVTGANAGTKAQATGRAIGSKGAPVLFEILALVILSSQPSPSVLSAASAAVTAKYGAGVAV